jgi:hypothetical protein
MYTRCHTQARPSYRCRASAKRNLPWCASQRGVGGVVATQYSATNLVWLVCAPVKERHASQDVLADVGECSMATGVRKCEGGQLAKKNLRGAMRRRRRRQALSNPLRPYRRFLRVKTPFHMTYIVLRYCQPTQPQQLARVAQTWSANSTKDARFVACRGAGTGRSE